MPQTAWKGVLTFGLVTIPCTLHLATEPHPGPELHTYHAPDGGRIRMRRTCEKDGSEVPLGEVARGFETPGGRPVLLTDEDVAALPVPSRHTIAVLSFLPEDQIDPLRLSTPYYVGLSGPVPAKPYVLLREAMAQSGLVALTKITLASREHLAVLRVRGRILVLQQVRWADELRSAEGIAPSGEEELRPQELRMARMLMEAMTGEVGPDDLRDEYTAALEQLLAEKVAGMEPAPEGMAAISGGNVVDLLEALQRSLDAAESKHSPPAGAKPRAGKKPAKKAAARKPRAS